MSVANGLPLAPGTPGERGLGGEGRTQVGSTRPLGCLKVKREEYFMCKVILEVMLRTVSLSINAIAYSKL